MVTRNNKTRQKRDKNNKKIYKNNKDKKKRKTQRRYFRRGGAMDAELTNYFMGYIEGLNKTEMSAFYNSYNLEKMCNEFIVNDDKYKKEKVECWLEKFAQTEQKAQTDKFNTSKSLQTQILLILGCILGLNLKTKHKVNCDNLSKIRCNTSAVRTSAAASIAPARPPSAAASRGPTARPVAAAASNAPTSGLAAPSNAPLPAQRASDSKPCVKDAGGRGDCFYFSVYEALKERDGLLEKLETKHSSLAIENKDKFMKSFRLRIALSFSVKPSEKYKKTRLDGIFEGLVYHLFNYFIELRKHIYKNILTFLNEMNDEQYNIISNYLVFNTGCQPYIIKIFIDSFSKIINDDEQVLQYVEAIIINASTIFNAHEKDVNVYRALIHVMNRYKNSEQYKIFRQKLIENIQTPTKYSNEFDIKEAIDLLLEAGIKVVTLYDTEKLKNDDGLPKNDDGLPIIYLYTPEHANHFQYISFYPDFDTSMKCLEK